MFNFCVHILVVSLVIGSRGFGADSATNIHLESQPPEGPDDYEKEEKSTNRHLDCQPDSQFIQEQISLTTKLLQDGEKFIQKQHNLTADETVLILGKAGSGKTSLVQFLIENDKLHSKVVNPSTGEYIFEDGEKIGTSATESFTLYPELVNFHSGVNLKTDVNLCDSPGFHDSRSSVHEIVSMNVMKSITNKFKKAKILIVENHASLQYGVTKDSFIKTLRYVNDFVVDIDKYRDHLMIVASKVPLTYKITDDIDVVGGLVTDDMLIESIVNYMNQTEQSLIDRLKFKKSKTDEEFYRKVIRVLKSLQSRDENGKATRINVFRRPYSTGTPKSMKLLMKNRESLLETLSNLDSVEVKPHDFDYTLSNAAKMYLECILELTSDNYKNKINELSFKVTDFVCNQKTQNFTSIEQILTDLKELHESMKNLSQSLEKTTNYNDFFELVDTFLTDHKIPLHYNNYNGRVHVLEKYEEMLFKFVDKSRFFTPTSWILPIRQVIANVKGELKWYQTLQKLIEGLSTYEVQKNKTEIRGTIYHENLISTNDLMTLFMSVTDSKDFELFMEARGNLRKSREMEMITNSLLQNSNVTCDAYGKLIVKGFVIRLSEINSEKLVRTFCNDIKLREVALLAVDTVYLDEQTADIFRGVNMFIAAPKWKVLGERKIILTGVAGSENSERVFVGNGKDGKPGLPGGNGGNFFGIGRQFSNGGSLKIETNGGTGGRGADGDKGDRGEDGKDGVLKIIEALDSSTTLTLQHEVRFGYESNELTRDILIDNHGHSTSIALYKDFNRCEKIDFPFFKSHQCMRVLTVFKTYRYEGDCGKTGGPGGLGGEPGIGGHPGQHKLVELGGNSGIIFETLEGSPGLPGNRGAIGDRGSNGIAITCYNIIGVTTIPSPSSTSYWKCFNSDDSLVKCEDSAFNSTIVYSKTGIKQPDPQSHIDFGYYLYHSALLLNTIVIILYSTIR
ncbi:uncharacterized protein LOC111044178 [Nilaparvata lugens]|uniref:uncharacterized protein LOC111044178 n=1 Tax=Nilaparvata lugens TaxID=108931 RepID=UPI00193CEC6D|nr:uncharacterized protein LOC111044178 [Nilaparvata lugens]